MTQICCFYIKYMFDNTMPWIMKKIKVKVLRETKLDSSLFLPLINYKGLNKKTTIIPKEKAKEIVLSRLNNKYKLYIEILKTQDNLNNTGVDLFNHNMDYFNQDVYLDIIKNQNKVVKLFNENLNYDNIHYLGRKFIRKNILEENYNDLKSRGMSNKLLLPHYFFTGRFNENSMPSQVRF